MNFENFEKFIDKNTDGFLWGDQDNINFLKDIVNYFGTGETSLDRSKGLLIRGSIGVGKTAILRLIQKWLPQEEKFAYNPANDVVGLFNASGEDGVKVYKEKKNRLFDDLGAEDQGVNYGNRVEVFEKIILKRYDSALTTHFTTNLSNKELQEKYGHRAYDRLKEMCQLITWNAVESKRGGATFKYKHLDEGQKEPTTDDLIQIRYQYINQCFLKPYKCLKSIGRNTFDHANAFTFAKMMIHRRLWNISDVVKKHYREKAQNSLISGQENTREGRKKAKMMKEILPTLNESSKDHLNLKLKERAAVLYFYDYIQNLIDEQTDIEKWLNDNKFYDINYEYHA